MVLCHQQLRNLLKSLSWVLKLVSASLKGPLKFAAKNQFMENFIIFIVLSQVNTFGSFDVLLGWIWQKNQQAANYNHFLVLVTFLCEKSTLVWTVYPNWDTNDIFNKTSNSIFFEFCKNFKFLLALCNGLTNKFSQ